MIPAFPQFREVDLSIKKVIDDFLTRYPLEASEYTFSNLFAFRFAYDFKISVFANNLIIFKDVPPVSMFCPIGNTCGVDILSELFNYLKQNNQNPYLERIPQSFVDTCLKGIENLVIEEDRDNFDYVYSVRELVELSGNKFRDKRNHVNRFRNRYRYKYQSLTPDLIEECLKFEDYWCEVRDCEKDAGLKKERCAILEMLKNFKSLDIKGGIVWINNKIAALALGEKFLPDTLVIHVEKANPDISGLYQIINQEFLIHEAGDCTFVNREQDLGIPGMRKAKMSYNPVRFVKKYKVRGML